jgi:hypothetical protein
VSCDTAPRDGRRDLVAGWSALYLWIVPTVLIVVGALVPPLRTVIWIPAFAVMGLSCLVNARRCGRLHCHATGPLFLLAALLTALAAVGVELLRWQAVLALAALGTVLAFAVEWARGRYVGAAVS